MSRVESGMDSRLAASSVVLPPNRPETRALPPAKVIAGGVRRQPAPSRPSKAGPPNSVGRPPAVPLAAKQSRPAQLDRPAFDGAAAGQPEPAGCHFRLGLERESAAAGA